MATTNFSYSGRTGALGATVSVSESSTSGTSRKLKVTLIVTTEDGYGQYARNFTCTGDLNGTAFSDSGTIGTSRTVFSGKEITVNVPYGQTSASVSMTFTAGLYSTSLGYWVYIDGGFDIVNGLTKDNGESSISSVQNVNIGSACSVTWTPPSRSTRYKLEFSMGTWNHTTDAITPNTTSSYTYTGYTIPYESANQIPNSESGTMTVKMYSYSDSACTKQIGSASSETFTVTLPSSAKPTLSTCTATIDNSVSSVVKGWNIAVAGFTKVRVQAAASGIYGSRIVKYTISGSYDAIESVATLDYTGSIIQSSGSKTFTVVATDSRGRSTSAVTSTAISFSKYTAPNVLQVYSEKNSNGRACVTASFTYDTVGGKNSATAILYSRQTGSPTWSRVATISNETKYTTSITPSDEQSYYFKVVLTDSIGNSSEKETYLSTRKVLLDFKKGGDGLGVGKVCESPGMEVSMKATFTGGVYINSSTLEQYIQSIMKVLPSSMYGTSLPTSGVEGQIFFKKV